MVQDLKEFIECLFSILEGNVTTTNVDAVAEFIGVITQVSYST